MCQIISRVEPGIWGQGHKPWTSGKQLPLGFITSWPGDTVTLLQRVMALAKELKQQVTWRKRLTGGFLITDEAPSHKLDKLQAIG